MTPNPYVSYSPQTTKVTVEAPARLHLGFLDLHGGLGRRFGSLGLALEGVSTVVHATPADTVVADAPDVATAARAQRCAAHIIQSLNIKAGVRIEVESMIPQHAGLGSGTQLSLGIGAALKALFGLNIDTITLAEILTRGGRSGIGIGAFECGGFLVDGGRGTRQLPPPVVARADFPSNWRLILVFDRERQGLHGERESEAFLQAPRFSEDQAAHLCRITLMRIMPALVERDFGAFARGVGELQRSIGEHFAHAQGGVFTSPEVGRVLDWARAEGCEGVGQSSWGPTGFVIVDSVDHARTLLARINEHFNSAGGLDFTLVGGRNTGGRVLAPRQQPAGKTSITKMRA